MINKALNYQFSIFNYQFSGSRIVGHPLFSGSAIMIVGSNLANFFAYLYHLIIGRMLGPSSYGDLAVTISLIGMFTITFNFLGLVIVKFVSAADNKDHEKLLIWFFRKAIILGFIIGGLVLVLTPFISGFLNIESKIIVLVAPILFLSIFTLVFRSFLLGLLKFKGMILLANSEIVARLLLGVLFVGLGYSVYGAVVGMVIASGAVILLGRFLLKEYRIRGVKADFSGGRKVFNYMIPIFISSLAINSFFSTDLLLVKHFFDPYNTGIYASMSALGKIIFFGTAPVGAVMFPMISKRHAKGRGYKKIFFLSMGLVSLISLGILAIYYFFPELMVRILYGNKFIEASQDLIWFGLFMTIFSLSAHIISFYLSKGKTRVAYLVLLAALMQAIGIWFYHDSILEVIKISILSASFLFGVLLIYFGYESKKHGFGKE